MRINAYVLAGDPAWTAESVESYYPFVDRLVVSYDEENLSWSGHELEVPEALRRLEACDPGGKIVPLPGRWSAPDRFALDRETEQRQCALDAASEGADWVVQLDTDEVLGSPERFLMSLKRADAEGFDALHYPSRWWYQRAGAGSDRVLERRRRFGGVRAEYPGAIAVRAGTRLSHCRQADVPHLRVDFAATSTDPAHPADAVVHDVVTPDEGIIHLSWVRTAEQMERKRLVSGHAGRVDLGEEIRRWRAAYRHPRLTAALGFVHRHPDRWLRVVSNPLDLRSGDRLP
ncbi:hypothetical protein [Sanguibacter sp. 25GB23B1]|uniref:hypothetical protein n=1 Tax=unclassified Sanguibacter TaxID=2645534 RepID=UPI0032AFC948